MEAAPAHWQRFGIHTLHTEDVQQVQIKLRQFVDQYPPAGESINIPLRRAERGQSPECFYDAVESIAGDLTTIARGLNT